MEHLPPTSDALALHLQRANYQAKSFLQPKTPGGSMETPEETAGWRKEVGGQVEIVWMPNPAISSACIELILRVVVKANAHRRHVNVERLSSVVQRNAHATLNFVVIHTM